MHVLNDALHQVSYRHANGPGGVALQLNNLIGPAEKTHKRKNKQKSEQHISWTKDKNLCALVLGTVCTWSLEISSKT